MEKTTLLKKKRKQMTKKKVKKREWNQEQKDCTKNRYGSGVDFYYASS